MDSVSFHYEEDAVGRPSLAMTKQNAEPVKIDLMTQLEPLAYCVLSDVLPARTKAVMMGAHDGAWACLLAMAMRNRQKDLQLTCPDAQHAQLVTNMASWGVDLHRDPCPDGVQCAFVDVTRLALDHVGPVLDLVVQKLRPDGWLVVRGSSGPARQIVQDSCESLKAILLEPPYGFDVSVCHRDAAAVEKFGESLAKLLEQGGSR